ncbi:MAG: hypothetical protein EXS09_01555 [Gemmataceae bacterium]|nr:hypothetical protein [Gemmataceae bacterium]
MHFLSAKVAHLSSLRQGQADRRDRVLSMVAQHDQEGFGHCTNQYEGEAACPKSVGMQFIDQLNRDALKAINKRDSAAGKAAG